MKDTENTSVDGKGDTEPLSIIELVLVEKVVSDKGSSHDKK